LVAGGGQYVGQVAQVVLDLSEGLIFGQVDEAFGHLAEDLLAVGAKAGEQSLNACFAIFRGLAKGRSGGVQHGNRPGVGSSKEFGFPVTPRS
jgi:hypothetical protein